MQEGEKSANQKLSIDDFKMISMLGKGTYAKVFLVQKVSDKKYYAMKVLKKNFIERKNQEIHTQTERNVLVDAEHPFIIKLHFTFQNERKLYFILEFCRGGELFYLL